MKVQINTDKTLSGNNRMQEYFTSQIKTSLKKYENHITRIEVHLKDENGLKRGFNDKSCTLEARLKGLQPIAITSQADTMELAMEAAINKIGSAIKTIRTRIEKRH